MGRIRSPDGPLSRSPLNLPVVILKDTGFYITLLTVLGRAEFDLFLF
ncbi:hypothetical protein G4V39_05215 [Thermosulfuriphilus ammonigenes]|uniref:Uncharacterized protein n=1 Tax=Thermosulfuriphilus ammonigenes TaxID=1936021 RepID=A0A6G7PT60_9BACT|nr:hypothetical protein [Thermosulfuriphilus ammonigenes]MBA2848116.1 hypothetical protein [Thermosulfuriphilus ammonigenes]QIJ70746.1 hypothetical protein G4V39_05215 [Thermosulfuriphilus ammonigenes]